MSKPTVISLYTSAGDFGFGLEPSRFKTKVAAGLDPDAVPSIRENTGGPVLSDCKPTGVS